MKKLTLLLVLLSGISIPVFSQKTKSLHKVIELQMPEGTGFNGACVAYHPIQKKYYASFAGNATFPMAIFDLKGKRLSNDTLKTGFDTRGLWYNSTYQTLQANGYADNGWTNYKLNKKGIPISNTIFNEGMNQPDGQCVAAFDDKKKELYLLSENMILTYDLTGIKKNEKELIFSDEDMDEDEESSLPKKFNNTTVVFTGMPKAEWGLYDIENKSVALFDMATGKKTQIWNIGDDAPEISSFCFAYTNGTVFLFDKDARIWYGYK